MPETSDMWHWRGKVEQAIEDHSRRLDVINGDAKAARAASEKILVELAVLRTKVAIWASLGGLLGAGFVSGMVSWFT